VRRPADPDAFNGVVVVEWLNVTGGRDLDALFRPTHTELLGEGYAWVGVSVQKVGVDDLERRDPDRYGGLQHPGDDYAFDIFTRAGRIVADPASPVLGGLRPQAVLASGASQSATGLLTYVNAVQPLVDVYDGFYLQSQLGTAMALPSGSPMPARPIVRTDVPVPVLDVRSETELVVLRTHLNRQEDSTSFRLWEFAGSSHIGEYGRSLAWPPNPTSPGNPCTARINSAPSFALGKAATAALAAWTTTGVAPPSAPRIELADPSAPDPVARDQHGNALGGIRYPHLEVPVARVDGLPNSAPPADPSQTFLCVLSGRTLPFSDAELAELYPTSQAFVGRFGAAANMAVDSGFLLPEDAEALKAAATQSPPGDPS
jgi:Alpha/beta hydrolase domain